MASYRNRPSQHYKGSSNTGASGTWGDKVLSTLYNPFSIRNNQPKWPDGLANHSIGRKQQFASEFYGREAIVVLFPGCTNWCLAYAMNEGQTGNQPILANHGDDRTFTVTHTYHDTKQFSWSFTSDKYSAWRGVSYALKIRCCNNDEHNDGWFEAVRTSRNTFLSDFGVVGRQTAAAGSDAARYVEKGTGVNALRIYEGNVLPSSDLIQLWTKKARWDRMPTYATGKLKDIGELMFQLNNEKKVNDFFPMRHVNSQIDAVDKESTLKSRTFSRDATTGAVVAADQALAKDLYVPWSKGDTTKNLTAEMISNFQESFVSDSFDIIIVRIHGVDNSRILLHSVANIELMCGEFSDIAQFATVAYSHKEEIDKYVDYRQTTCKLAFHTTDQYQG